MMPADPSEPRVADAAATTSVEPETAPVAEPEPASEAAPEAEPAPEARRASEPEPAPVAEAATEAAPAREAEPAAVAIAQGTAQPPAAGSSEPVTLAPSEASGTAALAGDEAAAQRARRLPPMSRRQALKLGAVALPSLAGAALVFERLSAIWAEHTTIDIDPIVAKYDPAAHDWAFVVDTTSCIGCGLCVVACKEENGVPLDEEHTRTWVERHVVTESGKVAVDSPDAGMLGFPPSEAPAVPAGETVAASYFVPRLCMQCAKSPCTQVCPVGATYRTPDGVILVDEERCIGCGYCVVACPYGARYLVPAGGRTPTGTAGVADKCTWCYHRIVRGQEPACVQACPRNARIFGDLNDPQSEVSRILAAQPTTVMRPDLLTEPRVRYIGLDRETA